MPFFAGQTPGVDVEVAVVVVETGETYLLVLVLVVVVDFLVGSTTLLLEVVVVEVSSTGAVVVPQLSHSPHVLVAVAEELGDRVSVEF